MQKSFVSSTAAMGQALERLSTGKRFSYASEDLTGFVQVTTAEISETNYSRINNGLKTAGAALGGILATANDVMDDLKEMQKAWAESETLTAGSSAQLAAAAKATAIGASIAETIATNVFDGTGSVEMVNGTALSFAPGSGSAPTGAEATAADTATAITDFAEYIGGVGSIKAQVDSQQRIAATMMANADALQSAITSIDEAAESAAYMDNSVRQQASLAMMSQANMARQSVLLLYK